MAGNNRLPDSSVAEMRRWARNYEAVVDSRFTELSVSVCDLEDQQDKHKRYIKYLMVATVVFGTLLVLAVVIIVILLTGGPDSFSLTPGNVQAIGTELAACEADRMP